MSARDMARLRRAAKAALNSEMLQRHGAVVCRGGSILSVGWNKHKFLWETDQPNAFGKNCFTVHAEVDALKKVKDPTGCTLYVVRVRDDGELLFSKPCADCSKVLQESDIKAVVHS